MDAISVPDADEIVFAPTNPVTVAFLLAFSATAQEWISQDRAGIPAMTSTRSHHIPDAYRRSRWALV